MESNNLHESYHELYCRNINIIEKLQEINNCISEFEELIFEKNNETDIISDINIKKYRNIMEKTHNNTYCIGYRKISKLVGLKYSQGRQIFEHLKQIGVIKTTKKGTKIIKFQRKAV